MNSPSHRLPRIYRLRRQGNFVRVHEANHYVADATLVIRGVTNELGYTRLGVSLSRQVGNAVVRNRWKRLTREAFRRERERLPAGMDLVVRPRRGAVASLAAVTQSLRQLVRRLAKKLPPSRP